MALFISPSYSSYLKDIYIEAIIPKCVITNYDKADILILRTGKNIKWEELAKKNVIINHSPFDYIFTDKAVLALSYPIKKDIICPIVLGGGIIDIFAEMKRVEKLLQIGDEGYWILKPPYLFGGKGIKLLKNVKPHHIADEEYKGWVLQKYIENPMLINGRKFDIRFFVLETQTSAYIYRIANLRLSGKKYVLKSKDMAVHLTNVCYQQKQGYSNTFKLLDYDALEKTTKFKESDFKKIVSLLKEGMLPILHKKPKIDGVNHFELYGIDVMFTATNQIFITEFNTNPAMEFGLTDKTLRDFRVNLLSETFDIVLKEISGKKIKTKKYVKI